MFKLKSRMHSHETRQKNYIHIAGTRTVSAKQCIRQYIPTVLTSIPTLVSDKITTHSYAGFSRYAKQYFIQLYKYECVISNCYICSNATYHGTTCHDLCRLTSYLFSLCLIDNCHPLLKRLINVYVCISIFTSVTSK